MFSALCRIVSTVALTSAGVADCALMAQTRVALNRGAEMTLRSSPEDLRFQTVVERFASLEFLMLQVPAITDAQRGQIEALEEGARYEFFRLALPLRDARRTVLRGWPVEDIEFDRPLNALIVEQRRLHSDARALLTPEQQKHFDWNTIQFWRAAGIAPHVGEDTGIWAWNLYIRRIGRSGTVNPATVP